MIGNSGSVPERAGAREPVALGTIARSTSTRWKPSRIPGVTLYTPADAELSAGSGQRLPPKSAGQSLTTGRRCRSATQYGVLQGRMVTGRPIVCGVPVCLVDPGSPLRHPGGEGGVHLLDGGQAPAGRDVVADDQDLALDPALAGGAVGGRHVDVEVVVAGEGGRPLPGAAGPPRPGRRAGTRPAFPVQTTTQSSPLVTEEKLPVLWSLGTLTFHSRVPKATPAGPIPRRRPDDPTARTCRSVRSGLRRGQGVRHVHPDQRIHATTGGGTPQVEESIGRSARPAGTHGVPRPRSCKWRHRSAARSAGRSRRRDVRAAPVPRCPGPAGTARSTRTGRGPRGPRARCAATGIAGSRNRRLRRTRRRPRPDRCRQHLRRRPPAGPALPPPGPRRPAESPRRSRTRGATRRTRRRCHDRPVRLACSNTPPRHGSARETESATPSQTSSERAFTSQAARVSPASLATHSPCGRAMHRRPGN